MAAKLRLGTRASALARWQADWVAGQLTAHGHEVQLIPMTTRGDASQREPINNVASSPGVFTKELQLALLRGEIDLAVHSLKDLPTDEVEGLALAAVPPRESSSDALVSRGGHSFETLPSGATIGTGSLRRRAQLLHLRPDLNMLDIRGNVDTRLAKLAAGQYDALVLAVAGLTRLGLQDQITQTLSPEVMLPAVGQGALGIESRHDDQSTRAALEPLNDRATYQAVLAERALLAALRGGCMAPVGALAVPQTDGRLSLTAVVLSPDGKVRLTACDTSRLDAAFSLGENVARQLIALGSSHLIEQSRGSV